MKKQMRLLPLEYAVRNLGRSRPRLIAGLLGSTLVVLLVLTALAFVRGMELSLRISDAADNVILMRAGSEESVERSQIEAGAAAQIASAISGARTALDTPFISPEVHTALVVRASAEAAASGSGELLATLRGVTPAAFLVHQHVQIVAGRAPVSGRDELLVGGMAAARLGVSRESLDVGNALWIDKRPWTIVGRFAAPQSALDAEIWCPLADLQLATRRDSISCVVLTLGDAEFADIDAFCKQRLDLELIAIRESAYYARLHDFYGPIRAMVWATAAMIAIGGVLGGLNTLYAAFVSRVRELATLQTLGYSRRAIMISLTQEAMLMTLSGALAAALIGITTLDGVAVRFSMGAFGLRVDAGVVALALVTGVVLGLVGALPPAVRCLRLPVPEALRIA